MKKYAAALSLLFILAFAPAGAKAEEYPVPAGYAPLTLSQDRALSPELLDRLKTGTPPSGSINAVSSHNLKSIAENREILSRYNTVFSDVIKTPGATDQKSTGRCWMFATLNMLRPAVMEKYKMDDFEFSQSYYFFWDKLEKSNLFLETVTATSDLDVMDRKLRFWLDAPIDDGGQWNFSVGLIKKYGAVPKSVMKETAHTENSSSMNRVLATMLRKDAGILRTMIGEGRSAQEINAAKDAMLADVYRVLCMCLGTPPETFEFQYYDKNKKAGKRETFTPREFYEKAVGINLDDYLCVINSPTLQYGELYEIELNTNMVGLGSMQMLNVDMDTLKEATLKSLKDKQTVWFAGDSNIDMSRQGVMADGLYDYGAILGINLKTTKKDRILYGDTSVSHAMLLTGVDLKGGRPVKWKVENSWGKDRGENGFFTMYDDWFNENVFQCILHKKYLKPETVRIADKTPIILPEYDPIRNIVRIKP